MRPRRLLRPCLIPLLGLLLAGCGTPAAAPAPPTATPAPATATPVPTVAPTATTPPQPPTATSIPVPTNTDLSELRTQAAHPLRCASGQRPKTARSQE